MVAAASKPPGIVSWPSATLCLLSRKSLNIFHRMVG
jgi:hypothetical protein